MFVSRVGGSRVNGPLRMSLSLFDSNEDPATVAVKVYGDDKLPCINVSWPDGTHLFITAHLLEAIDKARTVGATKCLTCDDTVVSCACDANVRQWV